MAIYLEDYKDLISTFATIATICQFLTGSKICRDFMRKGHTGDVSGLPLVVGALNRWNFLWILSQQTLILVFMCWWQKWLRTSHHGVDSMYWMVTIQVDHFVPDTDWLINQDITHAVYFRLATWLQGLVLVYYYTVICDVTVTKWNFQIGVLFGNSI